MEPDLSPERAASPRHPTRPSPVRPIVHGRLPTYRPDSRSSTLEFATTHRLARVVKECIQGRGIGWTGAGFPRVPHTPGVDEPPPTPLPAGPTPPPPERFATHPVDRPDDAPVGVGRRPRWGRLRSGYGGALPENHARRAADPPRSCCRCNRAGSVCPPRAVLEIAAPSILPVSGSALSSASSGPGDIGPT